MSECVGHGTLVGSDEGNLAVVQGEREKESPLHARSIFQTEQEHLLVLPCTWPLSLCWPKVGVSVFTWLGENSCGLAT